MIAVNPRRSIACILVTLTAIPVSCGNAHAQKPSTFIISGKVTSVDGAPIPKARLSAASDRPCSGGNQNQATEANAEGYFQLQLPCPGIWRLHAEAQGFPEQQYEQHDTFSTGIVLTGTHPEHEVVFRMTSSGSIQGTVLDEAADPVRDARVFLLMPAPSGDTLRMVDSTTTDDRGIYEFDGLAAGGYQVAIQVQPWYAVAAGSSRSGDSSTSNAPALDPSLDYTYPITYYPAATDAASALTVQVAPGTTQQADVHLSPVPSVHVVIPAAGRGNIGFGRGRPMTRGGSGPQIQQVSNFGPLKFEPTSVNILADGSLDVGGFAPGDYTLANGRSRDDTNQQSFTVGKDARHLLPLRDAEPLTEPKQQATTTLNGIVQLAQKPCEGALLLLVPIAGGHIERQQSNTDGSFTFDKVPVGKYILVAIDQGWSLDLKDRQTLSAYLTRGLPIDLEGSTVLKTTLQAQSR